MLWSHKSIAQNILDDYLQIIHLQLKPTAELLKFKLDWVHRHPKHTKTGSWMDEVNVSILDWLSQNFYSPVENVTLGQNRKQPN